MNKVVKEENKNDYFLTRGAQKLEKDVEQALKLKAQNTAFEGSIELISGHKFPDIVTEITENKFYGVEVKSSKKDDWTSTGNSVLETTRVDDVERIYMLFGKLVTPVEFRGKKYEDCLSDVAVTHAPRYKIDMNLTDGETIFDKLGISYDDIRKTDNPAKPILNYYREEFGEDANHWWLDIGEDDPASSPFLIRFWNELADDEKDRLKLESFIKFPVILGSSNNKYNPVSLWLIQEHSILNPRLRDIYSSGSNPTITVQGRRGKISTKFNFVLENLDSIIQEINSANAEFWQKYWDVEVSENNKVDTWLNLAIHYSNQVLNDQYWNSSDFSLEQVLRARDII
ncbi:MAG TPA: hypothetical protein VF181_10075 [Balneolaceae bacterium]